MRNSSKFQSHNRNQLSLPRCFLIASQCKPILQMLFKFFTANRGWGSNADLKKRKQR